MLHRHHNVWWQCGPDDHGELSKKARKARASLAPQGAGMYQLAPMVSLTVQLRLEPTEPFRNYAEATHYLEDLAARLQLRHLSYFVVTFRDGTPDDVVWVATYDPAYMAQYMAHYTPLGDPAFDQAATAGAFADWSEMIGRDDPVTSDLERRAARFGITRYGLTMTMEDPGFGRVMFSVNDRCGAADWPARRKLLEAAFRPFMQDFHQRMKPLVTAHQS